MPTGVIVDVISVLLGGTIGAFIGNKLNDRIKTNLTCIFGVCSLGMGVSSIMLMENMPAVILSLILGTLIGLLIHFGDGVTKLASFLQKPFSKSLSKEKEAELVTILVLFCASGTGIYGALTEGMTGDSSILLSKAILDFFTAMIFATNLGKVISVISIPQFVVLMILFLCAKVIYPHTNILMINDFKACGGFIMLATGLRMLKLKDLPLADMVLAMILVMPFSYLWMTFIL